MYFRWPRAFVHGTAADLQPPGVLVLNDVEPADEATRHMHWRRWLHLYNTFQTLTGVLLATTEGLQHHDYETITLAVTKAAGMQPTDALSQAWASVLDRVLPEVKAGMHKLMEADVRHPTRWGMSMPTTAATSMPKPRPPGVPHRWSSDRGPGGVRLHLAGAGMDHRAGPGAWEVTVHEKLKTAGAHP